MLFFPKDLYLDRTIPCSINDRISRLSFVKPMNITFNVFWFYNYEINDFIKISFIQLFPYLKH